MKRILPLTLMLVMTYLIPGLAQPPCGQATDEPPGCVMCGPIYLGSTGPYSPGTPGPTFPCGTIENNFWLSIIAGSTDMSATILASDCQNGQGVQLLIYDQNLNPVSTCFSSGGNNIPGNVSASGLIPGEIYWIMVDGFAGDVCEVTLTVTGGVSTGPPDPPGPITANPDVQPLCPGAEVCYSIAPVNNATEYEWEVPDNATIISQDENQICVRYDDDGAGVVRVTPSNPCFPGSPAVTPVVVLPIPPTILPPYFFCLSDFPVQINGNNFNNPGSYNITEESYLGCDSVIQYIIVPNPQTPGFIDTVLCPGGFVEIDFQIYNQPGTQQAVIQGGAANGCDSIINLNITFLTPTSTINTPPELGCDPGSTVTLDGTGSSSGNNVTYSWSAFNGGVLQPPTNQITTTASAPGNYILTVSQSNAAGTVTCIARDTVQVVQQTNTINDPAFTGAQTSICEGDSVTYTINPITGATSYNWTVPNGATFTGSGTSITVDFGTATGGQVCVQAVGDCAASSNICLPITINPIPTSDFTVTSPICQSGTSTLTYTGTASPFATYTWTLNGGQPSPISGPGPHNISWGTTGPKTVTLIVEENGCESSQTSQTVEVEAPLPPPVISCDPTQTSVEFFWNVVPGANDYEVFINGVSQGIQTDTSILITGLNPGDNVDIEVFANGNTACGPSSATSSCIAQDCPDIDLNIDPVADICRDANTGTITLVSNPTGGAGNGTFDWSGPATTPAGVFDPLAANAGANVISLTYTEGTCTYTEAITINVNDIPTSDFSVDSPICIDETSTITYLGTASGTATFTWDFGPGSNIVSGTGAGPYEVEWASAGTFDVTLSVTENGCTSPETVMQVQVDPQLTPPNLTCSGSTTSSVTISWDPVPNATDYTVNLVSGTPGTYDPNTLTYTTTNMNPGDSVEIRVIANGNTDCGPSSATIKCFSDPCPNLTVNIDPIGPFCDDGNGSPVNLTATTGNNNGTYTWSGTGVNAAAATFDPNSPSVNPGTLTIRATYTLDNCTYNGTYDVVINEQPTANFTATDVICIDETSTVTYSGTASPGANYMWDVDGGTIVSGSGQGPLEVEWNAGGSYNISLVVEENNCPSNSFSEPVQVDLPLDPPMIDCDPTQNVIDFTWPGVPGASTYDVTILSGQAGNPNGLNGYTVSSLTPGDLVTIEVIANGATDCGPSVDTLTCEALPCPAVDIIMPTVESICLYPTTANPSIDVDSLVQISGTTGNEGRRWHDGSDGNSYITTSGEFFPYAAGAGTHQICLEVEEPSGTGCFTTACTSIDVFGIPLGGFAVEPQICITDVANPVVTNAPMNSTFYWDFGNANVLSGSSGGPYMIDYDNPSPSEQITLVIETNGCFSDTLRRFVEINEELTLPESDCDATNTSVFLTWDTVPGATDYDLNVITPGVTVTSSTPTSATFDGLVPRTLVEVELIISDSTSACPPVIDTLICLAKECPKTKLLIDPLADDCIPVGGGYSTQMTFSTIDDPGNGTGIATWSTTSGGGITPGGVFTPTITPPNNEVTYNIRLNYEYDACFYDTTLQVTLFQTPTADFTSDPVICESETATVTYTGNAGTGATFTWDYDGGVVQSGTDRTPQEVSWTNDTGNQDLTLTVDFNGCQSAPVSNQTQVDELLEPLVITCDANAATTTSLSFNWNDIADADNYEVFIDGVSQGTQTGTNFNLSSLQPNTNVDIRVIAYSGNACPNVEATANCSSLPCPNIQLSVPPVGPFCLNEATPVDLSVDVTGSDGSGTGSWSGTAVSPTGTFNPIGAGPGTFTLTYTFNEQACTYDVTTTITNNDPPVVDAGEDQALNCLVDDVTIGSNTTPDLLTYEWTFNGNVVGNSRFISVEEGGTYTLEVTDPATGCVNTDNVFVDASFTDPTIRAQVENISCFGRNDGVITINGTDNGVPPYLYSFNGGAYSSQTFFTNLGPGSYTVGVQDANGCEDEVTFTISEPDELNVEIVITTGQNPVPLGDSVLLSAVTNFAPDLLTNVSWTPIDQFPICDETNITNCLSAWVTPTGQTVYTVRIEAGPCAAEDAIQLNVKKIRPVYIPSGFSPRDQDGINDGFQIYADPKVATRVKSFLIFDRWGEKVFEAYDFEPSLIETTSNAWDGSFRGKVFNPGVFVYYAEIEFFDGLTEIFKGDVTIR